MEDWVPDSESSSFSVSHRFNCGRTDYGFTALTNALNTDGFNSPEGRSCLT